MVFGAGEHVQGCMADGGHVLWGVIGSHTRGFLMEDDIQRPVQCIFDGPVRPYVRHEQSGLSRRVDC